MHLTCVTVVLVVLLPAGQDAPMFSERVLALRALSKNTDVTPDRLRDQIADGLADPDPKAQETALALLAFRAGRVRFDPSAAARGRWEIERPALEPLRPAARRLFESPHEQVRLSALLALGGLEATPGQTPRSLALGVELTALLAERYAVDPSPVMRSEIVKALSFDAVNASARPVIVSALRDSDPYVVQFAIHGIGRHRLTAQVPALARLLRHPSHIVRTAAAGALGTFGAAAVKYLLDLEWAMQRETDPVARSTMEGAISVLAKGGAV